MRNGPRLPSERYDTLTEARASPTAVVVLSGDFDSTVYLTAPIRLVLCSEQSLTTLHSDLDAIAWMGGKDFYARISYHEIPIPGWVQETDGQNEVVDDVWVDPSVGPEVQTMAEQVIAGRRDRIPGDLLRRQRQVRLDQVRARRGETPRVIAGQVLPWNYDFAEPVVPFPDDAD